MDSTVAREADETMALDEYWATFWRRRWWFAIPFFGVLLVSALLALLLPPTYRSEATILIERQTIPSNLVESTVTGYIQEQIQQIRQRIVTWDNLAQIAEDFDLYPDERAEDRGAVVRKMVDSIEVEMVDVRATDANATGERVATIAFIVAFNADTPESAQAVAAKLANDYLEEHKVAREEKAAEVLRFLEVESDALRTEISELEKQLANFKQQELRQLPELMDMNLKLYEKAEQDISDSKEEIRALVARYALALDMRDLDALCSLFPPDVRVGKSERGREALRRWFDETLRSHCHFSFRVEGGRIREVRERPDPGPMQQKLFP